MKYNKIKIKKISQLYFNKLINDYDHIKSGRKNFDSHYNRVIKNILLSKLYIKDIMPNKKSFIYKNKKSTSEIIYKLK